MKMPLALSLLLLAAAAPAADRANNPVLLGADPEMIAACGSWWMYPTSASTVSGERPTRYLHAWQSRDLATWQKTAPILDMDAIAWIKDDGASRHALWAPGVTQANGRFYLYYSVGPQNPTPSRIGVAVGDTPTGPFTDSGRPLVADGGNGFEAIDPMVFVDPKSKRAYLYAGGSAGAKLRVWELDQSMTRTARELTVATPPEFTEGSFMHEREGVYYLSYSHGRYNGPDYSVHYATASSPEGPFTYRGPILVADATHQGPGHHSFARNPKTDAWFVAYHRWDRTDRTFPFKGNRVTAIEKIRYDSKGMIRPIKMTDGPAPRSMPPSQVCAAPKGD